MISVRLHFGRHFAQMVLGDAHSSVSETDQKYRRINDYALLGMLSVLPLLSGSRVSPFTSELLPLALWTAHYYLELQLQEL